MNKELTVFQHEQFGSIRRIIIDNKPWLVGKDVAMALGYADTKSALADHVDVEDKQLVQRGQIATLDVPNRGLTIINESGLYSLVFSSKLEGAKQFKRWVTAEVLPTINETGGYVNNDELFVNTYMPYADDGTKAMFLLHLKAQRETNEKLKEMSPKAEYFDRLIDRGSALSIRDTAKSLNIKETALKELLFDHGYIYRDQKNRIRPYAEKNKGYFVLKEFVNDKNGHASVQTLITVEGREKLLSLLNTEKGGIAQ